MKSGIYIYQLIVLLILVWMPQCLQADDSEVLFKAPICDITSSGNLCVRSEDLIATFDRNKPLTDKITAILTRPDTTRIMVSSFYLGEHFVNILATSITDRVVPLTVISDNESVTALRHGLAQFSENDSTGLFQLVGLHIPVREIPISWHTKILLVEHDFGKSYSLITTSGNFRLDDRTPTAENIGVPSDISLNFETYFFENLELPEDDLRISRLMCFFDGVSKIVNTETLLSFDEDLGFCLSDLPVAPTSGLLQGDYFLPTENLGFLAAVSHSFGSSNIVKLSSYNYNSAQILRLIQATSDQGGQVKILTDDDAYCNELTLEDRDWIERAQNLGAQVKLIPTDGINASFSRYHRKDLIFRRDNTVVAFSGSMNFTCAGLCRNIEYMKTITGSIAERLEEEFDTVWKEFGQDAKSFICD